MCKQGRLICTLISGKKLCNYSSAVGFPIINLYHSRYVTIFLVEVEHQNKVCYIYIYTLYHIYIYKQGV